MNKIKIIYEDDDIVILDKPSGITVNKSETTREEYTVQDYILDKFPISNFQFPIDQESDFYKRAGIVHRIDKETSGILIVAKNKKAFEKLQDEFKERRVEKTYVALVHGKIKSHEGEISVPVGRLPWNRRRFGVLAGGKEAVTNYRVISNFPPKADQPRADKFHVAKKRAEPLTLLELTPKTGRTHQIRVHLKYFNHPIFSDFLYAGRKTSRQDRKLLGRVFLHARKISFIHPKTNRKITFESELPPELAKTLDIIKD
ncbi:MAG: RluA family pseudouridine synthase [Candidatus Levybacteria bacterium CG10_big_fil_rev_8_21_14_0_10_35_13]|nr:MAG: RluA family pseudouridine synthase [Candidatus Levybacteria bacterium CG10_big_fil_rev_8_21_14_0_10_35_13]